MDRFWEIKKTKLHPAINRTERSLVLPALPVTSRIDFELFTEYHRPESFVNKKTGTKKTLEVLLEKWR